MTMPSFTAVELNLVADALDCLYLAGRRAEVLVFAAMHPEFPIHLPRSDGRGQ